MRRMSTGDVVNPVVQAALIGDTGVLQGFQKDAIEFILGSEKGRRNDTLIVQPTGAGKSLCYQLPILQHAYNDLKNQKNSFGVVVTPTVALIEDQVSQLTPKADELGLKVSCYHHCLLEKGMPRTLMQYIVHTCIHREGRSCQ